MTAIAEVCAHRYEARVHEDIGEVDPSIWDGLVGRELLASHRFVLACQQSRAGAARFRHLIVYADGEPVGVATLSAMDVSLDLLATGIVRQAARYARREWPGLLRVPVAMCGLPVSFSRPCLAIRPGTPPALVLEVVASRLEEFAAEVAAPVVCFKEFDAQQTATVAPLAGMGYVRAASLPSCALALPFASFDSFVAAMRAGYRRQVMATVARRVRARLRVRATTNVRAECERILPLYDQVMDHAPFQLERLDLAFFHTLAARLPGDTHAILLEGDDGLKAAGILLVERERAIFLLAGIDYDANRPALSYENLVIEVIAEAIRQGARSLEMGQTSYALKTRLGAVPSPRYIFLKCRSRGWHRLLRATANRLFPETVVPVRRVFR
jgi:predicted N-acyltransferase